MHVLKLTNDFENRVAEERFINALDEAPLAVCITGLDGKVIDCNQTTLDLFGLETKQDYRDKFETLSPEFQPCGTLSSEKMGQVVGAAIASGSHKFEWLHVSPSGIILPCEIILKTVLLQGETTFVGYIRDLREQREITEKLEAALLIEQKTNYAKNLFLSNLSHEIRTPLNAIMGMVNIAKQSDDINRKNYCIGKIESTAKHMLEIFSQIVDMSTLESGELTLHPTPVELSKMIDDAKSTLEEEIAEKSLRLSIEIAPSVPSTVVVDRLRTMQIIANILSNAVKFSHNKGSVTLQMTAKNEKLHINISDNGSGIADDLIEHLFDAFEQVEAYTAHKFGGAGLGLPMSRRLIEKMGGEIKVESKLGAGSSFIFTIPYGKYEESKSAEPRSFNDHTILLVEDVELNREIVIALLESTGINIESAEDGVQAVKMFSEAPERYSLIFMDLQMPEMDGLTATRTIRAQKSQYAQKVPIVALTANVLPKDVANCIDAGMNAHTGKPIDFAELLQILDEYIGHSA